MTKLEMCTQLRNFMRPLPPILCLENSLMRFRQRPGRSHHSNCCLGCHAHAERFPGRLPRLLPSDQWFGSAGTLTAEANQWLHGLHPISTRDYDGALQSCDTALRLDASNARARQLKAKVEEPKGYLGRIETGRTP